MSETPEGLEPASAPRGGLRHRIRSNPTLRLPYRVAVFLVGLLFIAAGIALAALPGPLTIPPVLLGLWIWSTEFGFAERLFDSFKEKGREAWAQAKRRPVVSAFVTAGGVALVVAMVWAEAQYSLVNRALAQIF
jgi:hypothetical protein